MIINKKSRPLLSIGMIVKNEEDKLEKCLRSLCRLKDSFPCEIIVTDTGSEDRTVQIAEKYADKVLHYRWTDDFAAARNFGLRECSGEWFFYIDADEVLDEDISPLLDFFGNKQLLSQYNSAAVMRRDYRDSSHKIYSDVMLSRIVRIYDDIEFKGKIHETMPVFIPQYEMKQLIHHYGYAFESEEQSAAKTKRNMAILEEEIKKDRYDIRTLLHMFYISDTKEDRERLIAQMLEAIDVRPDTVFENAVLASAAFYFLCRGRHGEAVALADRYFAKKDSEKSVTALQMRLIKADSLFLNRRFEQALPEFERWFETYKAYKENRLSLTDMKYTSIIGLIPSEASIMLNEGAKCALILGKPHRTMEFCTAFTELEGFSELDEFEETAALFLSAAAVGFAGRYEHQLLEMFRTVSAETISDKFRALLMRSCAPINSWNKELVPVLYLYIRLNIMPSEFYAKPGLKEAAAAAAEKYPDFSKYVSANISSEILNADELHDDN